MSSSVLTSRDDYSLCFVVLSLNVRIVHVAASNSLRQFLMYMEKDGPVVTDIGEWLRSSGLKCQLYHSGVVAMLVLGYEGDKVGEISSFRWTIVCWQNGQAFKVHKVT